MIRYAMYNNPVKIDKNKAEDKGKAKIRSGYHFSKKRQFTSRYY